MRLRWADRTLPLGENGGKTSLRAQKNGINVRDVIFIVGMGRSGSSALTRVLSLSGAALPLEILPPNYANPTGYWEPAVAVAMNDRFLHERSSSWYDSTLRLQTVAEGAAEREAFIDEIAAFLIDGFEPGGPLVVKDPRISALLPYWTAAAEAAGLQPAIIHNFRRPDDVAMSLACRDALEAGQSESLWLKYNLVSERDGRPFRRVFVSYEALMSDWRRVATRCIDGLGIDLAVRPGSAVSEFLSPELHHHASLAELRSGPERGGLAGRTYALLRDAEDADGDSAAFDAAFHEFAASFAPPSERLPLTRPANVA